MLERKKIEIINKGSQGQAFLPVLILLAIILTLGAGILYLSIGGILISYSSAEGEKVLMATEGALENGLLRILRNPTYAGESLQIGGLTCTITASGQSPYVVTAECQSDKAVRRLEAQVNIILGEIQFDSFRELE